MLKEFIGKRSNNVLNVVERGAVRKFAEAIGDSHPIYTNEEYASQTRYKQNICPPTFPIIFDYGKIEGLIFPSSGLIHGEQYFHYERPLYVGEKINCYSVIEDLFEKQGSRDTLAFLVINNFGEDEEQKTVFTCKKVIVITDAVRKEMNS